MLSRLFLVPTLLLVGITTVVIGMPVAETIEIIKALETHNMGSGNLTLNRRFIKGVPGLPQCLDDAYPDLVFSNCLNVKTIRAFCASRNPPYPRSQSITTCPDKTTCMDFRTNTNDPRFGTFAICMDDELVKKFQDRDKDGVICKSFEFKIKSAQGTLSINVYDYTQKPFQVEEIRLKTNNQYRSSYNTHNYSTIINANSDNKVEVCLDYGSKTPFIGMFSILDGTYSG